ncbi:lymphokine-activated killer T-cell-originated protein kinase [Eurytemora carolleeae]|uniref:lymphokine-activated killer T-cell-originated protein kinase n=1 Tax=Eurytemora carolleeae TaxID=1294199 RepID=UPI000C756AEF|nr:lymphokine-activated killer T-cell-originated protein kinase [Eurytemora carolleeae]|eukprot:XP_023331047.1 lymphokine-activated killer T-cell-originated protein kinase-like [Eurytemora affinis]
MFFSINSYKMLYLVCNEVYISIFTDILEKMEGFDAPCTPKPRNKLIQGSVTPCTPKPRNNLLQRVCQPTPKGLQSPAVHIPSTPYLKKLGFGTGVSVYLYERSPQGGRVMSPWAVKRVNLRHENTEYSARLEAEAKVLRTLSHPHIIGYRGFEKTDAGPKNLVMEDGHRSLYDIIETRKDELDTPFSADYIEKVIRWIAEALDYLHTEKQIMHGDLKSANILVVGEFDNIKLCDFGVTLEVNSDGRVKDSKKLYIGTDAWAPMEALRRQPITTAADIFAFGLVIFEMIALHPPHVDKLVCDESTENLDSSVDSADESFDDSAFREALGTRPPLPDHLDLDNSYAKVLEVFFAATMEDPRLRPSARDIINILDSENKEDSVLCVNVIEAPSAL